MRIIDWSSDLCSSDLVPDIPFQARFVDDIVNDLYNRDERRAQLFGAFAVLAVVIGCLGLFGLAAFTAERRTKEIGIRKVLGARTRAIVRLLVWQFSRPVLSHIESGRASCRERVCE